VLVVEVGHLPEYRRHHRYTVVLCKIRQNEQ